MKTREWNTLSLRFGATRMENSEWNTRSVLECGSPLTLPGAPHICRGFQSARGLAQSKTWRRLVAMLLFATLPLVSTFAQTYSIDWYKIAGGGGTSTGSVYAVSGTIGQHDAGGPMTGGNYSLTGGFWALISVVQTAGAPTLFIRYAGNTVTVYWQDVSGWNLQQNGNLALPAGWSASSGVTTTNGTNYLNVTPPAGNLFFQLKK
jgi:hypothetical protein